MTDTTNRSAKAWLTTDFLRKAGAVAVAVGVPTLAAIVFLNALGQEQRPPSVQIFPPGREQGPQVPSA